MKTILNVIDSRVLYVGETTTAERNELRDKILIGSKIYSCGIVATIKKVLYAEITTASRCDIEFIDSCGKYRHWKQSEDKGYIECRNLYFSAYGTDVTNSFEKFGYQTTF